MRERGQLCEGAVDRTMVVCAVQCRDDCAVEVGEVLGAERLDQLALTLLTESQ